MINRLGVYALAGLVLLSPAMKVQGITDKIQEITVEVLDGRNGKPMADQHVLVFIGVTSAAVRSHAQHTGVTTGKDGNAALAIFPAKTMWLQVFMDGRIPCFADPNGASFSVDKIMSQGLVTPNTCSSLVRAPSPGHFIIFARPAHFTEKIKR